MFNKIGKDDRGETVLIIKFIIMVAVTVILAAILTAFVFYPGRPDTDNINTEEDPRTIKILESNGLDMKKVQCSEEINESYSGATCWMGYQDNKTITIMIS